MTPTTTRLSADERRDEIVAAAMTEFAVTGYAGTSTEAIARRSGVSQPYLFQLFGTKKDLFIAAIRHGFGRTITAFDAAGRAASQEDPSTEHVLDAMGQAYCVLLQDRELLLCQLQAYAACSDPEIRQAVGEEWTRMYRLVRDLSGASEHELEHWLGKGMLMNTAAAIGPEMAETGEYSFAELGRIAAIR
jgi:AcrR family transcriptional regulator